MSGEEAYILVGFNQVLRDLVKLNYPKLKNCPPFTGRKPKKADLEKVDDLFFYVTFLETCDAFLESQLMPIFLGGLNAYSVVVEREKLLQFSKGRVLSRLQGFFGCCSV
jgi:hypothetical protein